MDTKNIKTEAEAVETGKAEETTEKDTVTVDKDEFNKAMEEAKNSSDVYTHTFRTPFEFDGEQLEELTFDFGSLTAADSLAIENELAALHKATLVPEFSGEFMIRMAARACTYRGKNGRRLGEDSIRAMRIKDWHSIRSKARSFLIWSGS